MRSLALALVLCLAFAPTAHARQCRDAKGHFTSCPAAASTGYNVASGHATSAASAPADGGGHPDCKKGKPCGNSCIAMNKTCHK